MLLGTEGAKSTMHPSSSAIWGKPDSMIGSRNNGTQETYRSIPPTCNVNDSLQSIDQSTVTEHFATHSFFPRMKYPQTIPSHSLPLGGDILAGLRAGIAPLLSGCSSITPMFSSLPNTIRSVGQAFTNINSFHQPVATEATLPRLRASSCHPLGRVPIDTGSLERSRAALWMHAEQYCINSDQPLDLTLNQSSLRVYSSAAQVNTIPLTTSEFSIWRPVPQRKRSRTCVEDRTQKIEYSGEQNTSTISDEENSHAYNTLTNDYEKPTVVCSDEMDPTKLLDPTLETSISNKSVPLHRARRRRTSMKQRSFKFDKQSKLGANSTLCLPLESTAPSTRTSTFCELKGCRSDSAPPKSLSPKEATSIQQIETKRSVSSSEDSSDPGRKEHQLDLVDRDEINSSKSSSADGLNCPKLRRSRSAEPTSSGSERSTAPGDPGICNPKMRRYPEMTPSEVKDDAYWQKRVKNNEAARRSRRARKSKEATLREYATQLEKTNLKLTKELDVLKKELDQLKEKQSRVPD